jgi:replicative DNA helicase
MAVEDDDKVRQPVKFDFGGSFQTRILRTLYQDQDLACTLGVDLSYEHFDTPARRWLAQKIIGHAKKHGAGIGADALKIELRKDIKLGRLPRDQVEKARGMIGGLDQPVKDRSYVAEKLFEFIKHQITRNAVINIVDGGLLERAEWDACDAEMVKAISVKEALAGGLGHFLHRDRLERLQRRRAYEQNGVPTGIPRLDEYLKHGGLPPKAIGTAIAPSGVGKSSTLVFFSRSAIVTGTPVLYVTTELSLDMISDKFDASLSGYPIQLLERKRKKVSRKIRKLGIQHGEFLVVKEFAPGTLSPRGLRAFLKQLERVAFYPGLIVVDSADDMIPDEKGYERDAYEDYGGVWRGLRWVSYDVHQTRPAPVWTASQTQRSALNKEFVDWDSTADSAKKIMVSDAVCILQQTKKEQKQKLARIHLAKNRFGQGKVEIPVRLDWARCIIHQR